MVGPSDIHTARILGFLERPRCEFLARRGQMAGTDISLAGGGQILCDLLPGIASHSTGWIPKKQRPLHVSTASNRHCRVELCRIGWINGVAFNPVRLWQLH